MLVRRGGAVDREEAVRLPRTLASAKQTQGQTLDKREGEEEEEEEGEEEEGEKQRPVECPLVVYFLLLGLSLL